MTVACEFAPIRAGGEDRLLTLARAWLARKETGPRARKSLATLLGRVRAEERKGGDLKPELDALCKALRIIVRTTPSCPLGRHVAAICPRKHRPRGKR